MKKLKSAFIIIILISACTTVQYKDATEDKGSIQWGPKEIKSTVNTMVGSLYQYLKNDWKQDALIQVKKIRNRTSEHIDTKILSNEIVTSLIRKRIQFLDDQYEKDAIKEMEKGMTGIINPEYAIPAGQLQSPNIYLYGEINENMRFSESRQLQYIVVTLKLKEIKSGRLLWQDQKEFLKVSRTRKVTF